MKLFRVQAAVCIVRDGWALTVQVPTFYLDGDQHGLKGEEEARQFAERMVRGLAEAVDREAVAGVTVSVVEV